jgi:hypothetical protein
MSIVTDAREYADSALDQGKAALDHAKATLDHSIDEGKATLDHRLDDGKAALGQATGVTVAVTNRLTALIAGSPNPAYVAVGAADLALSSLTKRSEELPGDAIASYNKATETSKSLISLVQRRRAARLAQLRRRIDAGYDSARSLRSIDVEARVGTLREAADGYVGLVKNVVDSLGARGEARVGELLDDPRISRLTAELAQLGETVTAKLPVGVIHTLGLGSGLGSPEQSSARPAPARKVAAKKAAAKRAAKAPANKAPAEKAAGATVTARKATARTATAGKAAAANVTGVMPTKRSRTSPTAAPAKKAPGRKAPAVAPSA